MRKSYGFHMFLFLFSSVAPLMLFILAPTWFLIQVKFHVISRQRLQSCSGTSISSMHHLNMEQLAKTLTSLYNIYDANRKPDYIYENEAEFRSLYVLLHLNPSSGVMVVSFFSSSILFLYMLPSHRFVINIKHGDLICRGNHCLCGFAS